MHPKKALSLAKEIISNYPDFKIAGSLARYLHTGLEKDIHDLDFISFNEIDSSFEPSDMSSLPIKGEYSHYRRVISNIKVCVFRIPPCEIDIIQTYPVQNLKDLLYWQKIFDHFRGKKKNSL